MNFRARQTSNAFRQALIWGLFLASGGQPLPAQESALPELRTAEGIRRLSPSEAERHYPVYLKGTVTFFDQRVPTAAYRFVEDETAGMYVSPQTSQEMTNLATGQLVEIRGVTGRGEFAPVVEAREIRILGKGKFPAAKPVTFEEVISGHEDSQFVEIEGVVRSARFDERSQFYLIDIATGGGRLTVVAEELPVKESLELIDSTVRVRGVSCTQFNQRRQLFGIRWNTRRRKIPSLRRRSRLAACCNSRRRAPTAAG
jgi:hypothetical protein